MWNLRSIYDKVICRISINQTGYASKFWEVWSERKEKNMKFHFVDLPEELSQGIRELSGTLDLEQCDDGLPVAVTKGEGIAVTLKEGSAQIVYSRKVEFFRALGLLAEGVREGRNFECHEKAAYESMGAFFDNSRNAVMKPETVCKMLRHLALMGHDTLYLYTEDTYEVEGQPYFGYMRGRFTADEIRRCDRYAALFGIELVPAIQTLAHLNAAFRWPVYHEVNDCDDILLAGFEQTYELIDRMLSSLKGMYSTNRINIGMDEAYKVGLGRYLEKFGYRQRFEIMTEHLARVIELCEKHGYKPMMWSDMFFHILFSKYDATEEIDAELLKTVPPNVTLVYWDYFSESKEIYDRCFDNHLKFNNEIAFAGGAWKWTGLVPGNHFSFKTSRLALQSCREKGIKQVMVTGWGDNGAECSSFAVLPVLQLFAEDCYTGDTSNAWVAKRLKTCANAELESFMALDRPNLLPGNEAPGGCSVNPSKYLLFQDILSGLFDRNVVKGAYNNFYADAANEAEANAGKSGEWQYIFDTNAALSRVLALKCDIGLRLREAYLNQDKKALCEFAEQELPELLERVEALHETFRRQWMKENKVYGFDVQDIRFGGLKERIRTAIARVRSYLDGEIDLIEELGEERLDSLCREGESNPNIAFNWWSHIATPNVL